MYGNQTTNQQQIMLKKKEQIDDQGPISKKAQKNKWKKQKKHQKQQADIQEYQQHKYNEKNQKKTILTLQQKQYQIIDDLKRMIGCSQSLIRQKLQQANYNKQQALNLILNRLEDDSGDMMELFDNNNKNNNNKQSSSNNNTKSNNNNNNNNNNKTTNNNNKPTQNNSHNSNQKKNYSPPTSSSSSNQIQQQAYKILNEIYQKSQIQISGFQFQQLFNEITQIIKQDQKQKGRGVIEINNFVQQCMTAKDTILVGLKDVFKVQAEIEFDQNDPVNIQLQRFIYQDTQKKVQQQVINKQQFPTLGQSGKKKRNVNNNNNNNSFNNNSTYNTTQQQQYNNPSIVNQLQNQHKHSSSRPITKQDLFKPSNQKPIQFIQRNSIFNVDNQQQSQDALRDLHKAYNHVSINTLKIVYLTLDKNYHQCRLFLDSYYPKDKILAEKKIQIVNNSNYNNNSQYRNNNNSLRSHRVFLNAFRRQSINQIDKQLQTWTLNQLRAEIQHLYGLRQVFNMTCKNINNSNQRKQLMRIADDRAPLSLIQKLSKASRVILIQQTMRLNPNYVDLHGYREQQVSLILKGMIAGIREQFDMGNEKVKFRTIAGRTQAIMQIMTGKGRHSQYGKSILKPCVKQWCQQHDIRAIVNDDNVEVFVPLN